MANYLKFCGPARTHKAFNSLYGIWKGIKADDVILTEETERLRTWLKLNDEFKDRHPFSEVYPTVVKALEDGVIDTEERENISWLLRKLSMVTDFYDQGTASIQKLHGIMQGIIADGKINTVEIKALSHWIDSHDELKTMWPYDEIESLVTKVLADGIVDEKEQAELKLLFQEFSSWPNRKNLEPETLSLSGVCALTPEITIPNKTFCITGESSRCPRSQIEYTIKSKGGVFWETVTLKTDYLVVGSRGNPCWAYSCYGRKIEKVIKNRVKGARTLIVHENDFWDTIMD